MIYANAYMSLVVGAIVYAWIFGAPFPDFARGLEALRRSSGYTFAAMVFSVALLLALTGCAGSPAYWGDAPPTPTECEIASRIGDGGAVSPECENIFEQQYVLKYGNQRVPAQTKGE